MLRPQKTGEPVANRLLAAMTGKEYQWLGHHLEEGALSFGEVLYESGEIIRRVYFPNHGIVSLLSMVEDRSTLEVGVVGAEGMVGISVFLGAQASPNQALVQGAGAAMSMKADAMRKHVGQEGPLPDLLRRYANSLLAQISQTAACSRFHAVEAVTGNRSSRKSRRKRRSSSASIRTCCAIRSQRPCLSAECRSSRSKNSSVTQSLRPPRSMRNLRQR
jgi:CRP-like cAMP-binding protein